MCAVVVPCVLCIMLSLLSDALVGCGWGWLLLVGVVFVVNNLMNQLELPNFGLKNMTFMDEIDVIIIVP